MLSRSPMKTHNWLLLATWPLTLVQFGRALCMIVINPLLASCVAKAAGRIAIFIFFNPVKADKGMTSCLSTLCLREVLLISLHHSAALLNNFCWARSQSSEFCTLLSSSNADRAPVQRQIKTPSGEVSRHIPGVLRDCVTHFNQLEWWRKTKPARICIIIQMTFTYFLIFVHQVWKRITVGSTRWSSTSVFNADHFPTAACWYKLSIFTLYLLPYCWSDTFRQSRCWEHCERARTTRLGRQPEPRAETPRKASFKPQGSADSGDNSLKIYHEKWPPAVVLALPL